MIVVLGLLRGEALPELLLSAVSLALAAAPGALTAEVTIDLWLVAQRLLRRHALICKLPAVETLGSVTVICSDKTGTLTLNPHDRDGSGHRQPRIRPGRGEGAESNSPSGW